MKHRLDYLPAKAVCVPGCPPVDISEFLPVVDHPHFQKLRGRKQLGVNYLVFPGAVHTRFEHTMGVLGITRRFCSLYGVDSDTTRLVCAYALLHDIGHGPFSHQIEPILKTTHHDRGMALLPDFDHALSQCGVDPGAMRAMFKRQNVWHKFVSDRNFGTDKLDYLRRDALHIGFSGAPDIDKLSLYAAFDNRGWAIEEKFLEDVKRIQKFYSYLHQHGYLNKTALSIQRVFQRAIQEALADDVARPEAVWNMEDWELTASLNQTRHPVIADLMSRLRGRGFHRSVYVIKPYGYAYVERRSAKNITVREWSRDRLRRFSDTYADVRGILELENHLAAALQIPKGAILLAAMPYFEKLVPQDIRMFSQSEGTEYSLFDNDQNHFRSLQGDYLQTFAIRLIVLPELRQSIHQKASAITDVLNAAIPPSNPKEQTTLFSL
ncbi:MAG: HD domain-containing protein [Lentisphaeria bacterium]|nr:HD domain-containing protein [Lentisphaeria bacterium]